MIDELFNTIGCEKDLKEYHLDEEGIERMVEDAVIHGCTGLRPVEITKRRYKKYLLQIKRVKHPKLCNCKRTIFGMFY